MRLHRRFLALLVAALGAAVVVLPAVAGSETGPASVTAVNSEGLYREQRHYWSPAVVTVGAGGVVTFSNPSSEVSHGLEWTGGPGAPSCSGLPSGGATSWRGECSFAQPGTYAFRCTVHPAEMTGTVTVSANGTTTTTTPPPPSAAAGGTLTPTAPASPEAQPAAGSPLAGTAAQAVRLAARQHGRAVRGSIRLSQAASGTRLEVDLLAGRAALGSAGHGAEVRVGRIVRSGLRAGTVSFDVALGARGRHALRVHHRLALSVRIVLGGAAASVRLTRAVVLQA